MTRNPSTICPTTLLVGLLFSLTLSAQRSFPAELRPYLSATEWQSLPEVTQDRMVQMLAAARDNYEYFYLSHPPCGRYPEAELELLGQLHHDLLRDFLPENDPRFYTFATTGNPGIDRWEPFFTALGQGGVDDGTPITLTWSYVRDGTPIGQNCSGADISAQNINSDLIAFLTAAFGSGPTTANDFTTAPWHPVFVEAFAEWSTITGITFLYEPNDDNSLVVNTSGSSGTRGDIRLAGLTIDGNSNTLACAYSPQSGDVLIDTDDNFYANNVNPDGSVTNSFLNTIAHEIGHALTFNHVCPQDQTKLMEPNVTSSFRGTQFSELLGGNFIYGDPLENINNTATAEPLGSIGLTTNVSRDDLSIDNDAETDFFSFTAGATGTITITVTPVGETAYDYIEQSACSSPNPNMTNTQANGNLSLTLLNAVGAPVLTADLTAAGNPETLAAPVVAGTLYFVQVDAALPTSGEEATQLQLYDLAVGGLVALPVEFTHFEAHAVEGGNRLDWTTAWELNADYFAVERSTDGRNYTEIGRVAAAGFSETDTKYTFTDRAPAAGLNYYRLRQVDRDAAFEWSVVRTVHNTTAPRGIVVQPNPGVDRVTFRVGGSPNEPTVFDLFDGTGRLVRTVRTTDARGAQYSFDASELAPGVYTVRVRNAADLPAVRWVKQ